MKSVLKKYNLPIITGIITVFVLTAMVLAIHTVSEPAAQSESGKEVSEPWIVKAGEKEIALVGSDKEAKNVIEGIKEAYYKEGIRVSNVQTKPEMTYEKKELNDKNDSIVLSDVDDAVSKVLNTNTVYKRNPLVKVIYTTETKKTGPMGYKTLVKNTPLISKGEQRIVSSGKKGLGTATVKTTYENGSAVKKTVVDKEIKTDTVNRVIYKGIGKARYEIACDTNGAGIDTVRNMAYSVSPTTMTGEAAANYACQFIGNPYVYGGSSPTNGTDCSGFMMAVYARFGISLPHSSHAQSSYGRGVSYSQAKPGDLICYPGHVAMYIGKGKIVHAASPGQGIVVGNATYTSIKAVRRILK